MLLCCAKSAGITEENIKPTPPKKNPVIGPAIKKTQKKFSSIIAKPKIQGIAKIKKSDKKGVLDSNLSPSHPQQIPPKRLVISIKLISSPIDSLEK